MLRKTLIAFGSTAEDEVLKALKSAPTDYGRAAYLDILKEIGTAKSLPLLAPYLARQKGVLYDRAREAQLAIKQRCDHRPDKEAALGSRSSVGA